ncbi:MAG: DUF6772 family protein [Gemmatimonadota bacterium]
MAGPFAPLATVLYADDFDGGLQGWTGLIGNYEGSLDAMLPPYRDLRPPMLSNATVWDTGTGGSASGTYALKLATRPVRGSLAVGIKRLTYRHAGLLQLETLFAFKPEATELQLSEAEVGAVGLLLDLQNESERVMPHLRYLNAEGGEPVGRWQYKSRGPELQRIGASGKTRSHFHLGPGGWADVPGGEQRLCYNEIATKLNWHYLRVGFDLGTMAFTGMQCNDRCFDLAAVEPMRLPAMANLWCMLNVAFFAEAGSDRRAFLYLDSVVLSAEIP